MIEYLILFVLCVCSRLLDASGKLISGRPSGFHISDILELHDPATGTPKPGDLPDHPSTLPPHGECPKFVAKCVFFLGRKLRPLPFHFSRKGIFAAVKTDPFQKSNIFVAPVAYLSFSGIYFDCGPIERWKFI